VTWIIGRAGPFGYAVGLSDIRVTLRDGSERDCLQKIYNVGPHLVLGFAGSVAIGLEVINQLGAVLPPSNPSLAWIPQVVAENLPRGTKELFRSFPEAERKLGLQLILLAAHPTENDGAAPWGRCYVYRFSSPNFEPKIAGPAQIVSIGSGSNVAAYASALGRLENDFELLKFQQYHRDGPAIVLMSSISAELRKLPIKGISPHLHICIVSRGEVRIGENNIQRDDAPEKSFMMPPVATNMEELRTILSTAKVSSLEQARC
jgi:hypothetical protein